MAAEPEKATEHVELSAVERVIVDNPALLGRAAEAARKVKLDDEDAFSDALKVFREAKTILATQGNKSPSNLIINGEVHASAGEPKTGDTVASMSLDKLLKISEGTATYDSDPVNKAPVRHMTMEPPKAGM